jgi:hypothetical protein
MNIAAKKRSSLFPARQFDAPILGILTRNLKKKERGSKEVTG